jgi:hypothetical protein
MRTSRTARTAATLLLAASFALSATPVAAGPEAAPQAGPEVQTQEATGQAAILNGDKPAAREKAIADALRQAVQMAVGTQITSTTEVQDFQTKMDQVLTHSTGYVRKYDIVKESLDGDVVQVTIRAQVGMGELNKDLAAMGLLMARKTMPRTMLLIAEQSIGMDAPAAVWMRGTEKALTATNLRVAETIAIDELKKAGFGQIIDSEIVTTKAASVGGLTTEITADQARKLGSLTGAEVIIVGQVKAVDRGDMGGALEPGWHSCAAVFTGRAVNTDNGDILATAEASQSFPSLDALQCGKEAIKKATKAFIADLAKKIVERWSKDVSGGNQVHVTVKGVGSMKQASEFKSALTNFMRGVKGVSQRSFSDGKMELDITLVGTTDQFAEELEAKKLGKFSVKVKGVSANTVEAELGK